MAVMLLVGQAKGQQGHGKAFWNTYHEARLSIAKHHAARAIKPLEQLHAADTLNPNVAYLLAIAKLITGKESKRASALLEMAHQQYHVLWDNPGVGPPEHIYYYMILAYGRTGACQQAKEALVQLERVFSEGHAHIEQDEYYLFDGRKWAGLCKHNAPAQTSPVARLVKPTFVIQTQPNRFSTQAVLYGVQVGALHQPKMTRNFRGINNIDMYVDMKGVYRYVIGRYNFQSQAHKQLQAVKQAGYADAFVVQVTDTTRYPLRVVAIDQHSPQAKVRGAVYYQIQLAAYPVGASPSPRIYELVDSVEQVQADSLKLLAVGRFKSYGKAIEKRDEIRLRGISDAFIIAMNENRKIALEEARHYLRRHH